MDLTQVQQSNPDGPARVAIHGVEGSGKTTLACYFPKPLIIGAENGVPRDLGFTVPTIRPGTWQDLFDVLASLMNDRHDYQTVVLDTVDWMEPHIHAYVCERDSGRETEVNKKGKPLISIEDYGFGKGFLVAEEEFLRLINALDVLQYRKRMHIVMLMHTIVRTFKNPSGPDFDRYEPKCQARIGAKVKEWAENLLFLHYRMDASKISEDKERHKMSPDRVRAKGVEGNNQRLIGCQQSALFDAKNRVRLPAVMELDDPNVIVEHLLGLRLGPVQAIAERVNHVAIEPNGVENRVVHESNGHAAVDRFRKAMTDQGREPAEPVGVPAHHESRQVDEERRRSEALSKAAQNNEATARATPAKAPTRDERVAHGHNEQTLEKKLYDTIQRAAHLGPVVVDGRQISYKQQTDQWLAKAAGDHAKLEAIIRRIDKDIAASANQPAQR